MNKLAAENIIYSFIDQNNLEISKSGINVPYAVPYAHGKNKSFMVYDTHNKKHILKFLLFLRDSEELRFTILKELFATDFLGENKRFELVYSLLSLKLNLRILIKLKINEKESVESISSIHQSACWYEREVYDMFGIEFDHAKDLRRILTDYGFVGHPLRKDFPLMGHLEVKYDQTLQKVIYQPVNLNQEFRDFDFESKWQGPVKS